MHIYHRVPEDLEGSVLYPLNELRDKFPHIYERQVQKYTKTERAPLLEERIPALGNCLWNDVLFFTAIHPRIVFEALRSAGLRPPPSRFFELDAHSLERERAVVWLYSSDNDNKNDAAFVPFDPETVPLHASIGPDTLGYYREMKASRQIPLAYYHVPHILYKGTLDISNARIIDDWIPRL